MSFTVTIEETTKDDPPQVIKRYEQTVDELDIRLVQKAVNTKPRKAREPKLKKGAA